MQETAFKVGVGDEYVRHKFLNSMPANICPALTALADELVTFTKTALIKFSICKFSGLSVNYFDID